MPSLQLPSTSTDIPSPNIFKFLHSPGSQETTAFSFLCTVFNIINYKALGIHISSSLSFLSRNAVYIFCSCPGRCLIWKISRPQYRKEKLLLKILQPPSHFICPLLPRFHQSLVSTQRFRLISGMTSTASAAPHWFNPTALGPSQKSPTLFRFPSQGRRPRVGLYGASETYTLEINKGPTK
ncbi:hypothetical protein ElyMa_003949200 [Elysia marginata]|uniref:Uncharacterized protein n=1 Tax=Elysia marginata TaxID=1093978 RepID=A0AAV4FTA8_9GAST|nr:hypothetical protein ElyMa_003949200 [Elysia marginata]